jgi:hypothetical protein
MVELEAQKRRRDEVLDRYARKDDDGLVIRCRPTFEERQRYRVDSIPTASGYKVIYDSHDDALAASAELHALGSRPTEPYVCHRSTNRRHLHLRTTHGAKSTVIPRIHERQS